MPARAAMLALTMLAVSCTGDPPQDLVDAAPPPAVDAATPDAGTSDFAVRGSALGVLVAVDLELRAGSVSEPLSVGQDGAFAFATRLETGTSYTVALADPSIPCMLRNATGVITGADAAIELECAGASLAILVVSGIAPVVMLAPGTTDYVVELPLSNPAVTLTATVAIPGDTLTIAGTPVPSGTPSEELALDLGDNPVDIVVENDLGWQRTYHVTLRRAAQLAQYAYGKASDSGANYTFGRSVALEGDTLVVSAPGARAVYVFRRSGASWQEEAVVRASNTDLGDFFGGSVALEGDILAVGAQYEASAARGVNGDQADNSAPEAGAVYVFRRTGTIWEQEAYLKASNTDAGDNFGHDVALSGDTLAVGAPAEDSAAQGVDNGEEDNAARNAGAAYVFRRTGTTWQQEGYLKASNTGALDEFGGSVALSGDTLVVGAPREASAARGVGADQDDNTAPSSGAAYVFRRTGTTWQQEEYVKASNADREDFFGNSMALSGDTLAVGATGEASAAPGVGGDQDDNSASRSGAVYVFRRTGTSWQQEEYLKASRTDPGDAFGRSVAVSGDTLAVGADTEDSAAQGVGGDQADNTAGDSGAAYVFRRTGTSWQETAYLKASNTHSNGVMADDHFGASVALSGDTLVVGAWLEDGSSQGVNGQDDNGAQSSGAVYIFH